MSARLEQLLGVVSLAAIDRLREAVRPGPPAEGAESPRTAGGEVEAGALVHLQAWPGASVTELVSVVGLSQPATVRLVDRLEVRGLVRREAGPDRRTVALTLTDAGERAAHAVLAARGAALAPLLTVLGAQERSELERLLSRVAARMADDRSGAVRACRLCHRAACMSGPGCPMQHTMTAEGRGPQLPRTTGA